MGIFLPKDQDELDDALSWATVRLPVRDFGPAYAIGVMRREQIAAVVVYHMWREGSIEVSIAADDPRWATRQTVTFLLGYPFWTYGVRRLTALVKKRNRRSRKLCEGLGFKLEGRVEDAYEDDDAIMYGLTRRSWLASRWHVDVPMALDRIAA